MQAEAFFLAAGDAGQRFCLYHPAQGGTTRGMVLYVHPFAEEMNKSRRMAALQARALAHAGYGVLQIDLLGCGDSSGDFSDATWSHWVDDIVRASRWLRQRGGSAPLWLWGLRVGCLLAADAARQLATPCNFLFWQPASSGKLALQQFLRLKVAADMLTGPAKGAMDRMRQQLARGEAVEVAGYTVSPALAAGLEQASLRPPAAAGAGHLEWLELSSRADTALAPASLQALAAWRDAGAAVHSQLLSGPAFWHSAEIEEAPQLLAATLAALTEAVVA